MLSPNSRRHIDRDSEVPNTASHFLVLSLKFMKFKDNDLENLRSRGLSGGLRVVAGGHNDNAIMRKIGAAFQRCGTEA